jgi:hypothetical protein
MGYFEGLLGGFTGRKREVEERRYQESLRAADQEERIFNTLLSSPDPEVQSLAVTGLLESARPRKRAGGIRGYLGELESSPILGRIQELIGRPVSVTEQVQTDPGAPGLPSKQITPTAGVTAPSLEEAPMGTPSSSMTEPGAPQAKPLSYTFTPGPMVGRPPTFETRTTMQPRRVFPTPEDLALQAARGKAAGDVEGEVQGLVASGVPEVEAREIVKQRMVRTARGASGFQSIAGEMPDGTPAFGVFDRAAGGYRDPETGAMLRGFRPRTTTGSISMGADREAIARSQFGLPFARLSREQQQAVMIAEQTRAQEMSYQRGVGTGRARTETELSMPIGPTAAKIYNVAPTTPLRDLAGTMTLDDTQKDRVYALGQMDLSIADIDALLPQVFPVVEPGVKGAIQTALSLGMQKLGRDADFAALDAAINASLAQIAQLTGQPGSRLSDRDIEIARGMLASLEPSFFGGDTLETARARLNVVKQLLAKARSTIPTSPQGNLGTPPPTPGRTTPSAATPGARGIDAPVPGFFVDDQGNVVQR